MKLTTRLILFLVAGNMVLSSCKKDKEEETPTPTPTPAAPGNPNPAPDSAFGALVAIQTSNYITVPLVGEINQPIGVALGVFGNLITPAYVDAGTVSVNASALTKQSNGSYVFTPSGTATTGIDFGDEVHWIASGNATTSVPAIDVMVSRPVPTGPKYSGATSIPINAAFTLSSSVTIADADSIYYSVIGNGATVQKVVDGNVQSVTFSAAEMTSLGAGGGYVQIAPYNISSQLISGKRIYFVNESVATKSVTFQ